MLEKLTHKKVLLIFNKCDKTVGAAHTRKGTRPLDPYDKNKIAHLRDFGSRDLSLVGCGATPHGLNISISSLTGVGLDLLYDAIAGLYVSGAIEADDADLIMGARHADLLEKTAAALDTATAQLATGQPEDLVSISLRSAYLSLGEILGEQVHDDIVDRIFSEFCVGK
jgi:tRNA modification GTPase